MSPCPQRPVQDPGWKSPAGVFFRCSGAKGKRCRIDTRTREAATLDHLGQEHGGNERHVDRRRVDVDEADLAQEAGVGQQIISRSSLVW